MTSFNLDERRGPLLSADFAVKTPASHVMGASDEDFNSEDEGKKSLLGGFDLKSLLAKKNKSDPVEEPAE